MISLGKASVISLRRGIRTNGVTSSTIDVLKPNNSSADCSSLGSMDGRVSSKVGSASFVDLLLHKTREFHVHIQLYVSSVVSIQPWKD